MKAICNKRYRSSSLKILGYDLIREDGTHIKKIDPASLKELIKSGELLVDNLTLTKDGKLISRFDSQGYYGLKNRLVLRGSELRLDSNAIVSPDKLMEEAQRQFRRATEAIRQLCSIELKKSEIDLYGQVSRLALEATHIVPGNPKYTMQFMLVKNGVGPSVHFMEISIQKYGIPYNDYCVECGVPGNVQGEYMLRAMQALTNTFIRLAKGRWTPTKPCLKGF